MIEKEQILKVKEILLKMAGGIDPIHGEVISEESFLNDPNIIRSFYYTVDVLEHVVQGTLYKRQTSTFHITQEQINKVVLPEGKIGVSDFTNCINAVLDIQDKKVNSTDLNRRLRLMQILDESKGEDGRVKTIIGVQSHQYGFESERRSFHGHEYDKIVINDQGKRFLLENLERIMSYKAA